MKKHNSGNTLHIESRAIASRGQLMDLLSVFGTVGHFLMASKMEPMTGEPVALDGGVKSAVESTLITVCNRIDAVMADESRWNLVDRDALEKTLTKSYEASAKMFSNQATMAEEAITPHAQYRPVVTRLRPGLWLAIKGDLGNVENSICGIGVSPAEALRCFDAAFNGTLTKEQVEFITSKIHENTVDESGTKQITGTSESGDTPPGDSATTEPDPGVSSGKDSEQPPANGNPGFILPEYGGYDSRDVPRDNY